MSMERNHLWKVLPSFIFSLNQMRSTGYVVSSYIILLETHGFNSLRLNKQSERLRGCLSRHLRLHYRQKCVILPVPWADIAFCRPIYCTMTISLKCHLKRIVNVMREQGCSAEPGWSIAQGKRTEV